MKYLTPTDRYDIEDFNSNFKEIEDKINAIEEKHPELKTPEEVYIDTRPDDWLTMPMPEDDELYLLFHIPDGLSSLIAFSVVCTGDYLVELGTVNNGEFVSQTSTSLASGSKYEDELFADDFGDLTSDGFKQVMIRVSGKDITAFDTRSHVKKKSPSGYASWNIVEISGRLPVCTGIGVSDTPYGVAVSKTALRTLRYFSLYGKNSIEEMSYLFYGCSSLVAVKQLDTSKCIYMQQMFGDCLSLQVIPELNTGSVVAMNEMFYYCQSLLRIPAMDTTNVTNMKWMFYTCTALTSVPKMETSKVTNMNGMFYGCRCIETIPDMDTSNVTDMSSMFSGCYSLKYIPKFNTSNVKTMQQMFYDCRCIETIPDMDTSNVTAMSYMFYLCSSLMSVPKIDTRNVKNMQYMFYICSKLKKVTSIDTSKVTSTGRMFYGCWSLVEVPTLNLVSATDMNEMFKDCSALKTVNLKNTTSIRNCTGAFYGCHSLTKVSGISTIATTNMTNMFRDCYSLITPPLLDFYAVTSTNFLFGNATQIQCVRIHFKSGSWAGVAFSLADCSLSRKAIIDLFNSLPTITAARAITLTGNPGVPDLTDADKAIATQKGWTLTL